MFSRNLREMEVFPRLLLCSIQAFAVFRCMCSRKLLREMEVFPHLLFSIQVFAVCILQVAVCRLRISTLV